MNRHRKDLHMTKNLLKYSLVVLGLALSTCASAYGMAFKRYPEVDPSLAISGLTLLAGTLAVLRVRRKK
jgi:LPXTG-motif cell wall-anchored protein